MKRNKTEPVGNIINDWLKSQNRQHQVTRAAIVNKWGTYVGKAVARYTTKIKFEGGLMKVYLRSAVVRRELEMIKAPLLERINKEAGDSIVSDIVFIS